MSIAEVSSRSNLPLIKAAVEAGKAAEAGVGFAVVADKAGVLPLSAVGRGERFDPPQVTIPISIAEVFG